MKRLAAFFGRVKRAIGRVWQRLRGKHRPDLPALDPSPQPVRAYLKEGEEREHEGEQPPELEREHLYAKDGRPVVDAEYEDVGTHPEPSPPQKRQPDLPFGAPDSSSKARAEGTIDVSVETVAEPEPEQQLELEVQPEPESEQQPELEAQPAPEPEPQPELEAQPEPESEQQPELEAQPEPEPEPQPEVEAQSEPASERKPDEPVEVELELELEAELVSEPASELLAQRIEEAKAALEARSRGAVADRELSDDDETEGLEAASRYDELKTELESTDVPVGNEPGVDFPEDLVEKLEQEGLPEREEVVEAAVDADLAEAIEELPHHPEPEPDAVEPANLTSAVEELPAPPPVEVDEEDVPGELDAAVEELPEPEQAPEEPEGDLEGIVEELETSAPEMDDPDHEANVVAADEGALELSEDEVLTETMEADEPVLEDLEVNALTAEVPVIAVEETVQELVSLGAVDVAPIEAELSVEDEAEVAIEAEAPDVDPEVATLRVSPTADVHIDSIEPVTLAAEAESQTEDTSEQAEEGLAAGDAEPETGEQGEVGPIKGPKIQPIEVPKDYVPSPESLHQLYQLQLGDFEGPLDLLLFLIRRHKIDVFDIPIAFICREYLAYLQAMRDLNIDVAAEFMFLASELLHIKSKMLLPKPEEVDDEEDIDPRAELVKRLLEYQKYKDAAEKLGGLDRYGRDVFAREPEDLPKFESEAPLREVGVFVLVDAFNAILKRQKPEVRHQVALEQVSVQQRIRALVEVLCSQEQVSFSELVGQDQTKIDVVVTFLAMLEMTKHRLLRIYQSPEFEIYLKPRFERREEALSRLVGLEEPTYAG